MSKVKNTTENNNREASSVDTFETSIDKNILNNIKNVHSSLTKDDEFEFVFFSNKYNIERQKRLNRFRREQTLRLTRSNVSNNPTSKPNDLVLANNNNLDDVQGLNIMGSETFVNLLNVMKYRSKTEKLNLISKKTLDINYTIRNEATYRISLEDLETINRYTDQLINLKSHVVFKFLLELYQKGQDKISLIKKTREGVSIIDIEELDMRLKKSAEKTVTKEEIKKLLQIDENAINNIDFRFKERISLIVAETKNETITIDLTKIKSSHILSRLEDEIPTFELELELVTQKPTPEQLTQLYNEITKILKVIYQSSYIVTNSEKMSVLNKYCQLLELNPRTLKSLHGRQPEALEIQHVVDKLPNIYAVTDKADGDRHQLIIHENVVYLISNNLKVKKTGITLNKNNQEYNDTILDGEFIFIKSEQRYIFMAFDCLIKSKENIREIQLLADRLAQIDELVDNIFTLPGQKGTQIQVYDTKNFEFNSEKILKFHETQISNFMNNLNQDIKKNKRITLVRRKYFIMPFGKNDNEIYQYSVLIWTLLVVNNRVNCPYKLDGLIYQPQDQKYIASAKESKYPDYKWKPHDKNSIDFYIQYEKNTDGKIIVAYDNTGEKKYSKDKPYKIAQLFVGKTIKDIEEPVPFQPQSEHHLAYLFLDNGDVRDLEGKIIQDKTIVEFYYNNDINVPRKFRWVPIRTRYDKTEYMQRHGKKYGNYIDIANKNWRSIENPFTFNDMLILSRDNTYVRHLDILRNKIDHSVIISEQQENSYYQITTNLAKSMRAFHNWIKSITIYTYLMKWYSQGVSFDVLDFGCGRGGDIMKIYYVTVHSYVGIDRDNNGIISPVNGAISRYNQFRKNKDNFPPMSFINADVTVLLEPDEQEKVITNMSSQNRALMHKFFPKDDAKKQMFNCINCQFSMHYFASDATAWGNFLRNVNLYLKPGGIFLASMWDADLVVEALKDKTKYTVEYVNDKGETKAFMDIIKKYDDETLYDKGDIIGIGKAIDVYNATVSQEGYYMTEYLIQPKFLIKEFLEKCNLELIDTDTFENQYFLQEKYLKYYAKYESNPKTRKALHDFGGLYDQNNNINKASYEMTRLNRFYAFRKREGTFKGGFVDSKLKGLSRLLSKDFVQRKRLDRNNNYSFCSSVLDVLKSEKLVPESVTLSEFFKDKLINDESINEDNILDFCNNLVIQHEVVDRVDLEDSEMKDGKIETLLDGFNMVVLNKDNNKRKILVNKYFKEQKDQKNSNENVIILYKGKMFNPVYKGGKGIFKKGDKEIKKLV